MLAVPQRPPFKKLSAIIMDRMVLLPFLIALIYLVGPLSAFDAQSRIVGGTNATGNVCSHTVAIRLVGRDFLCNGALISNQDVLTAAQCVYNGNTVRNASEFQIVLGTIANSNNSAGAQTRTVSGVFAHPDYNPAAATRISDIAVLRLNTTVQSSASISPLQLGAARPAVNRTCAVCGWGSNSTVARPVATLQRIDFTVQPSNATYCTRANGNALLRGDTICAGDLRVGKGACSGDQGAPLVCDGRLNGILTVVAVGSCGALNDTSIFIDTFYHRNWITNRTQQVVPPNGGGSGGSPGGNKPGGGGGGGASHAVMQIWVVMMPVLFLYALR